MPSVESVIATGVPPAIATGDPNGQSRTAAPGSSNGTSQQRPCAGNGNGNGNGSCGFSQSGSASSCGAPPQPRKGSGRGPTTIPAPASSGSASETRKLSSQSSVPSTPIRRGSANSSDTTMAAATAGGIPVARGPGDGGPTDVALRPPTATPPQPASSPGASAADSTGNNCGGGSGNCGGVARRGSLGTPPMAASFDSDRHDPSLIEESTRGTSAVARGCGAEVSTRPTVKRSSSSSTISSLAAEVRIGESSINGGADAAATVRAALAPQCVDGSRERRMPSCLGAAPAKPAYRGPRVSSGIGAKDISLAPSPLLPFRGPSSSQHPVSPVQTPGQSNSQHEYSNQQLHKHQQQHSAVNRTVRFSGERAAPTVEHANGIGSPGVQGTAASLSCSGSGPKRALHRRVSDSSSHAMYSPGGGGRGDLLGGLTAPPPPLPPGLMLHRRPSDDSMVASAGMAAAGAAAAAAAAAAARRERSMRSASGEPTSPTQTYGGAWALSSAASNSALPSRPCSGGVTGGLSEYPSADGTRGGGGGGDVKAAGAQRASGHPNVRSPHPAGGGVIRRAVELTPLSAPGPLDGALREVLARAAAANAALLATGAGPLEPDFGYARVVEQHRRQRQEQRVRPPLSPSRVRETGHHQHHQHHQQQRQEHQEERQQRPAGDCTMSSPKRTAKQALAQTSSEATAAVGPGGPPPTPRDGAGKPPGSAAASNTTTAGLNPTPNSPRGSNVPPAAVHVRAARPPLAAKSRRSVLKATPPGQGKDADAAATPSLESAVVMPHPPAAARTHGSPSVLATASYRLLSLRRPSSRISVADSEGGDAYLPPATAAGGSGGGGGGGGGGSVGTTWGSDALDLDPMGFRTAENVDIRIHCLTFNMGGVVPSVAALPESLFSGSCLSPDVAPDAAHLYVVATQESGPLADWEAAVAAHLGRRYTRVAAETLMSIHIVLFAVRSVEPYITDVQTSSVATGVGNVLGNKGGVAVTFTLLGARVLLVGAHFAAHDQNVERRNADFHRICAGLFAPPSTDGSGTATAASLPRSWQATPERQRGGAAADSAVSGRLLLESLQGSQGAAAIAAAAAGGPVLARSNTSTARRDSPVGSTLGRSSRTGAGVTFGGVEAAEYGSDGAATSTAGEGGGADGADGTAGVPSRALTRAFSSSSVCSVASNSSANPGSGAHEGALRSRTPSFWDRVSFVTAHRHSTALLSHFDVVLWMGDLNYRVAGTPEVVKYAIDENMMEVLWANDQLQKQQKKGKVLQGFLEMPIAFAPTFKYFRNSDNYDLRRAPSWTDRVLYLVNADPLFADLRPLYYMSVPELRTSDHKPVIAGFELSICPLRGGDNRHARQRACVIT
ncbi:hypothetical protein VaNZ11_015812 [Volvox africanus]|uniref:Inositol polyphosphate-related phosphatase domain-containing protein n=1 Tax=Volvox africanus TaxID=51714 RepID=A0ABQ5SMR6_9CHLO|nr:hypothetical protein VaNZ11_015812 [Volvox africanus]